MRYRLSRLTIKGNTCQVHLPGGRVALADLSQKSLLEGKLWRAKNGKAVCIIDGKYVWMHRYIHNAPPSKNVYHRNGNHLDNRARNINIGCKP